MRVLFFMRHGGYARNFGSTLEELAGRGHRVHVALGAGRTSWLEPGDDPLEQLVRRVPGITSGPGPEPGREGWSIVGRGTRLALDYLRYLEPEYARAPKLRARAGRKAPRAIRALAGTRALRGAAGRRVLRAAFLAVERLLPWPAQLDDYLDEWKPDVVIVTPLVELGSPQADVVRASQARGIPAVLCVASWDNLTNKGGIRDVPDLLTVWNEAQRREAVELHGIPAERLVATGAQAYDHWFDWRPERSRAAFCAEVGLGDEAPFLLYVCSSPFIAPEEVGFVEDLVRRLGAGGSGLEDVGVLIRPHPQNARQWFGVDVSSWRSRVAVWPRTGADPVTAAARSGFYDSIHHSAAVVGVNTSAQIESAIVGRAVHTLIDPRFADTQEGTLHFAHLVEAGGGMLRVARSWDEHLYQLREAVSSPEGAASRNRTFLETFVRPRGLGRRATPFLADAIERAAALTPAPAELSPGALLVRKALTPAVGAVGWWDARFGRWRKARAKRDRLAAARP